MPVSSLNSVKIRSSDPEVVVAALEKWSAAIQKDNPLILAVGYFGSYVKKTFTPGSDLDVLVILKQSPHKRFFDRIPELYPAAFPIGVDLFAYTIEEIQGMKSSHNLFIKNILEEVVWITAPPEFH